MPAKVTRPNGATANAGVPAEARHLASASRRCNTTPPRPPAARDLSSITWIESFVSQSRQRQLLLSHQLGLPDWHIKLSKSDISTSIGEVG